MTENSNEISWKEKGRGKILRVEFTGEARGRIRASVTAPADVSLREKNLPVPLKELKDTWKKRLEPQLYINYDTIIYEIWRNIRYPPRSFLSKCTLKLKFEFDVTRFG